MRKIDIAVIGGGITGQLVQAAIPQAEIFDWRPEPRSRMPLTRNYGGNYLWEPIPGFDCRSFRVVTHIDGRPATPDSIRRYKRKIGKEYEAHIPNNWAQQFTPEMTGHDFVQLPEPRVQYAHRVTGVDQIHHRLTFAGKEEIEYTYLVSTIPLYSLCSIVGVAEPNGRFQFRPIYVRIDTKAKDFAFEPDVFYVNYLSSLDVGPYRFTDRNGERHYETLLEMPGYSTKKIVPGKIYHHPQTDGLLEYLAGFNIVTFGRYGSWRPDELVHETWKEIVAWRDALNLT